MKHTDPYSIRRLFFVLAVFVFVSAFSAELAAQKCDEESSIVSVRTTRQGSNESVVFKVLSNDPQFTVKTVRPPFFLGESDETVRIRGNSFRTIQFTGIMWMCLIDEKLAVSRSLAQVRNTYQFEGDVVYTVGLKKGVKYKGSKVTKRNGYSEVRFTFGK